MAIVKLLVAAVLLLTLPAHSLAADCQELQPVQSVGTCGTANLATQSEQYAARQTYCGNNLWRTVRCFVQGKVKITFSKPGKNNQQVCWDALDNIITQCGAGYLKGSYTYNGGAYTLTRCFANEGGC